MKVMEMSYHFGLVANFQIFFCLFCFWTREISTTGSSCYVYLSINGCEKESLGLIHLYEFFDHLWIFSLYNKKLQNQLNKSKPSELNYVELTCKMEKKIQGFQWSTLLSMMIPTPSCIHHQRRQENLDRTSMSRYASFFSCIFGFTSLGSSLSISLN